MATGDIVLLRDRRPTGPYTREQVREALARGECSTGDLAHTPGLRDWRPLGEVLQHLDHAEFGPPRRETARQLPPLPVRPPFLSAPVSAVPAPPTRFGEKVQPPVLPSRSSVPPQLPAPEMLLPSASFAARVAAAAFDGAILFLPVLFFFGFAYLVSLVQGNWTHEDAETRRQEHALLWRHLRELMLLVAVGFGWIYGAGLESSPWQATVGKQWLGLRVVDPLGRRLTFLHASGRHFAKYLSAVPCFLGFIALLFDPQKLTWHDRLADTRVTRREK